MARLRYNGLRAELAGSGLTDSGTTITFAAALTHSNGTNVPTITGTDYIPLAIQDADGLSEVVWLTAYTAAATTGTIARGKEGTTGVAHSSGDAVVCSPLSLDHNYIGVKVYLGAAYNLANAGAGTPIPWDSEEWDTDGFHDNATNNTRLTVPAGLAGRYMVSGTVASAIVSPARYIAAIAKNGAAVRGGTGETPVGSGTTVAVNVACEVTLADGDYMELNYYQDSGAVRAADLGRCGLSMHRIG